MIMRACLGSFNAMIDQTFSDGKLLNVLIKNLTYLRLFKAIPKLPNINQRWQSDPKWCFVCWCFNFLLHDSIIIISHSHISNTKREGIFIHFYCLVWIWTFSIHFVPGKFSKLLLSVVKIMWILILYLANCWDMTLKAIKDIFLFQHLLWNRPRSLRS